MFLRGLGLKAGINKAFVTTIKKILPEGSLYYSPARVITSHEWLAKRGNSGGRIITVFEEQNKQESAPEIYNYQVTDRFKKYYNRKIPGAYVVELFNGKVYGEQTNFIITPDNYLLSDLSREFGNYGGKPIQKSSLIQQKLKLPEKTTIKGRVAVLSTCGYNNFHHWNYDVIPRVHLLKEAGIFDQIDFFIISWTGTPFQRESLQLLGITEDRIINPLKTGKVFMQAEALYVPSLPSPLGTVSPWVVDFLRGLYNPGNERNGTQPRIYLSRKNVTSRKIINNDDFNRLLNKFSIKEVFPEDYTVSELAKMMAGTNFIISVHGSGLSNLCFTSPGTTVIDLLAPYHQDCYYWMLSNIRHSRYIGFFAEGTHPPDDLDLVKNKIDNDLFLNLDKMRMLLTESISV